MSNYSPELFGYKQEKPFSRKELQAFLNADLLLVIKRMTAVNIARYSATIACIYSAANDRKASYRRIAQARHFLNDILYYYTDRF